MPLRNHAITQLTELLGKPQTQSPDRLHWSFSPHRNHTDITVDVKLIDGMVGVVVTDPFDPDHVVNALTITREAHVDDVVADLQARIERAKKDGHLRHERGKDA
jgi:hypothetical protein